MTPLEKALQAIQLRREALNAMRDKIERWQDEGLIDSGYAEQKLDQISSRKTDLTIERDALISTGQVTQIPSDEQLEELAAAVERLRNWNVAAAGAQAAVSEMFTLISIATEG